MHLHGWTHAVLDATTGAPLGVAKDIEQIDDWGEMGTTLFFGDDETPQFNLLGGYDVLPMEHLDPRIRAEIALLLTYVPA
jgi:hypothetical protein